MTQHPGGVDGVGAFDGPVGRSARAAAQRLAQDYGPNLVSDVEAALYAAGKAGRPERYLDPISLAALIVTTASFAWKVYTDLKKKTPQPPAEVVERRVRVELPERAEITADDRNHVIAIVTEEIVRRANESENR